MNGRPPTSPDSIESGPLKLVLLIAIFLAASVTACAQQVNGARDTAPRANASHANSPEAGGAAAQSPAGQASLCNRDETSLFSCVVRGSGKLLSICGSKRLDAGQGYVQYRFGRAGKVDLEFPKERQNTQSAFRYTRYTRPLVTYLALRFETNGYLYSVHQNYNGEERPPVNESSVSVTPLGGKAARSIELRCRRPAQGSLMSLEDIVRRSDDEPLEP